MTWTDLDRLLCPSQSAARPLAYAARQASIPLCGNTMTHAQFMHASLSVATALKNHAVQHVGIWFDDAAAMAIALFACWRAECVAVLASNPLPESLAVLDREVDIWLSDRALPLASHRQRRLDDLLDHPALPAAKLNPDGPGLIMCTSGSSGEPKRVHKRWRELALEIDALESEWQWARSSACVLGSVSAQHMYGLAFRVLWPMCSGRPFVSRQLAYPEDLHAESVAHPHTVWISSPALLKRLSEHLDWTPLRSGLRAILSSGGVLPESNSEAIFSQSGCRPTEIYGSTETGAVAWRQGGSPWRLLAGVKIDLDAAATLRIVAPWVASAQGEQTRDCAQLLPDGCFVLLGRADRILKIEDKRISLPELERCLADHPMVNDARVGMTTSQTRLSALIALTPEGIHTLRNEGRHALVDALKTYLRQRIEPVGVPRAWRFMHDLPWNEQGKLTQHTFDQHTGPRPRLPDILQHTLLDDTACKIRMRIPLDLEFFSGHFTHTPVLPGVAQIGWAVSLAHQHLTCAQALTGIENLKFQRLIRPGDSIDLSLLWDATRAKLHFDYRHDGHACSSGRITGIHA